VSFVQVVVGHQADDEILASSQALRELFSDSDYDGVSLVGCITDSVQIGWWGDMGGPKQKGIVQYSALSRSMFRAATDVYIPSHLFLFRLSTSANNHLRLSHDMVNELFILRYGPRNGHRSFLSSLSGGVFSFNSYCLPIETSNAT